MSGGYGAKLPVLVAEGITVGYRSGEPVLREIFLNLERGKILAVIGPNGAGKTTLFKALCGELPLTDGKVRLFVEGKFPGSRQDIHRLSARKRALYVARVLQNEQPAWAVAVSDYVEAGLFAKEGWFGGEPGGAKGLVQQSLERVGIGDLAKRLVTELSGGEFRRVVIARALVQDPDILLLDEPTADLDMAHQMETLKMLKDLARSGKAGGFFGPRPQPGFDGRRRNTPPVGRQGRGPGQPGRSPHPRYHRKSLRDPRHREQTPERGSSTHHPQSEMAPEGRRKGMKRGYVQVYTATERERPRRPWGSACERWEPVCPSTSASSSRG